MFAQDIRNAWKWKFIYAMFKHRINELKTYLLSRGYNNNFLEKQFLRAADISRTNALQTKPKASNDVVPFVVTYNPGLPRTVSYTHLTLPTKRIV